MDQTDAVSIFIPTNGISLHAKTSGPDSGPFVILLHGFPEFWYGWHDYLEPISQAGYRIIAPDQRGYGLSGKPGAITAYSIDQLAKDVLGILDHYGKEKAVIAGHDWGAVVAWYLGMHYPERVDRLVIVNVPHPAAMTKALRKPVWKQLLKSMYIIFFQIPYLPEWLMTRRRFAPLKSMMLRTSRPGTFHAGDFYQYTSAWNQPGALTGGLNWYRALKQTGLKRGRRNFNSEFQKRISMPALVIWGDQDAFLEPILADWSMEWVDQGKLIRFRDASHWVLHEEVGKVREEILKFLDESG